MPRYQSSPREPATKKMNSVPNFQHFLKTNCNMKQFIYAQSSKHFKEYFWTDVYHEISVNPLELSGYLCSTRFEIKNYSRLSVIFMNLRPNNINALVFTIKMDYVYCAVHTESVNKVQVSFRT